MRIVITADTHMPDKAKQLPERLTNELAKADQIIHAGDWKTMDVYEELSQYGKVTGVYGNVDDTALQEHLNARETITINGYKIGVVHGHGKKKTTEKRAIEAFTGESADIIVFGHSHIPLVRYFKKQLLINPGSPTDKRTLPYYSFAILDIGEELHADLIFFRDKS
ncbi:metallophosphoesterase family protein [Lentibacillus juripiscarius]|uniref:Phosphoesterase n=1 Tax=Lentibacillus juripiscarius TaxID=257446 RepID=A0ABW5V6N7_9BACI